MPAYGEMSAAFLHFLLLFYFWETASEGCWDRMNSEGAPACHRGACINYFFLSSLNLALEGRCEHERLPHAVLFHSMSVETPLSSISEASEEHVPSIGLTKSDRRLFSSGELLRVFSARGFTFQCQRFSLFFFKKSTSALEWRSATVREAPPSPKQLLIIAVAALPTTRCRRTYGFNSSGVPEGLCNGCYLKDNRERCAAPGGLRAVAGALPRPRPIYNSEKQAATARARVVQLRGRAWMG